MSHGSRRGAVRGGCRAPPSADRLLISAGRHSAAALFALTVTTLLAAGAETAFPAVLGRAVDRVTGRGADGRALTAPVTLVAVLVVVDVLDELVAGLVVARATAWLRRTAVTSVLAAGPAATERVPAGDLVARLVGNAVQAGRAGPTVVRALASAVPALGALAALVLIDPWLCAAFLLALPLLVRLVRTVHRDVEGAAEGYLAAQGTIAARLADALAGVRTIFASGKLDAEVESILEPLPEMRRHGEGLWRAQMRIVAENGLLVALVEVLVLATAGIELARGRITAGELVAAAQYVLLAATITSVSSVVPAAARARAAAGRLLELVELPPRPGGRRTLPVGGGRIELRGATVRRAGEAVLSEVTLEIPPRALVAIVGRSGAGKSTLAAVAGGLIVPDEGAALLDGVPLSELSPGERCAAVTYGFEQPGLVGDTVADAIGFGVSRPPLYRLVEAASAAQADGFIRRLPERYRTELGAAPMSGGEAQRIGLARALAHTGRVLVLDDVAASLDTVTEFQILEVLLTGALCDRTRLIVAHRVSTASRADHVVWLDGGRVRAVAPHDLLWDDPDYREVFTPCATR